MPEVIVYIDDKELFKLADWNILRNKCDFSIIPNKRYVNTLCVGIRRIIDDNFISHFPHLKYILSPSTGIDHIKISNKNIKIVNLDPSKIEDIRASSEFSLFLILSILRRGSKVYSGVICNDAEDICGKTLGILGYGRIGKNVAKYAASMGANVIYHDIKDSQYSKEDILKMSDIILLAINCTENNRNYISYDDFSKMDKKPYFVNVTRDFLVNEDALIDALKTYKIKGAALDVVGDIEKFSQEFFNDGRLIVTPHVAGTTMQSRAKACNYVIRELLNGLSDI